MRAISGAAATALASGATAMVMLVEMQLSETLRFVGGSSDIVYAGNTYYATGALGTVEEIDDSPGENKPLRFMLSAVPSDMLAVALQEDIRNKPASVRLAVLDAVTHAVLDAPLIWTGSTDQMPVSHGRHTSTIAVTAEHRGTVFARSKPLRYTDVDQQRLYPGDTCAQYVTSQANHPDVWPAADFGRQ